MKEGLTGPWLNPEIPVQVRTGAASSALLTPAQREGDPRAAWRAGCTCSGPRWGRSRPSPRGCPPPRTPGAVAAQPTPGSGGQARPRRECASGTGTPPGAAAGTRREPRVRVGHCQPCPLVPGQSKAGSIPGGWSWPSEPVSSALYLSVTLLYPVLQSAGRRAGM